MKGKYWAMIGAGVATGAAVFAIVRYWPRYITVPQMSCSQWNLLSQTQKRDLVTPLLFPGKQWSQLSESQQYSVDMQVAENDISVCKIQPLFRSPLED